MKNKNSNLSTLEFNFSEDLQDLIQTHFETGEIVTLQTLFECFDDYVFWDNETPFETLFGKLDEKTKILIDIK